MPLVVDGAPGTFVELELVPDNGQSVGLVRVEGFLAPTAFPTRIVVPPSSIWIMGAFGSFTVKAQAVLQPGR